MAVAKDFTNIPESDVVINFIVRRYFLKLYTLILVYGLPGSGKSSLCQRQAQLTQAKIKDKYDKDVKIYIATDLLEFLKALRQCNRGDVIIIEEVSVLFSSRRAMAGENVTMNKVLDTCRKIGVVIFTNAPLLPSIDSHIRCLGNIGIQTVKILRKEKVVISKPIILQTNPGSGKTYFHKFIRKGYDVDQIFTRMPDAKRWKEYEAKKDRFMDELYEREELKAKKKKSDEMKALGKIPARTEAKPLTKKELQAYDLVKRQDLTYREAGEIMGVTFQRIGVMMKNIEKKTNISRKIPIIADESS